MGWPKMLCLVRHAESEGNVLTVDDRAKFHLSTHAYPLTERGKKQAQITGEYLRQKYDFFDAYYVSYYTRAKETMQIMFPHAKIYEDPRLAEAQRGIYHAMSREEIQQKYPEELVRKEKDGYFHYRAPGGENWADVELRIHSFLGTLNRDYEGDNVCIVVHGHWLLLFRRLIERFSIQQSMDMYAAGISTKPDAGIVENASVTIYECDPRKTTRLELKEYNIIPWLGKL